MLVRRSRVFLAAIMTAMVVMMCGLPMMMGRRLMMTCGGVVMFAGWVFGGHDGS